MRNIEEIKADINLCTGCMSNRHDCDENCNDCLYINYDKNYYRLRQENYNWYKDRDSRAKAISGIKTSRLEEICNAERDGRLVVLPCKVGDTVYRVIRHCTEAEFDDCVGCQRNINRRCQPKSFEQKFSVGLYDELGKTVFLTRGEAEAMLLEGRE